MSVSANSSLDDVRIENLFTEGDISSLEHVSIETGSSESEMTLLDHERIENRPEEVTIMVAGRNGAGKSTALNNIFGLNLETNSGPDSSTMKVEVKHVEKNNVTLHIIDTPGMGALDISKDEVMKDMVRQHIRGGFILLLCTCISVSPGNRLNELDETIITNLNFIFGKKVWNKCFPLFTFSDILSDHVSDPDTYRRDIEDYCRTLKGIFQSLGITQDVTTIYGYETMDQFMSNIPGMVALPVGKGSSAETTRKVLPDLVWVEGRNWTEVAFFEIMKRASEFSLALAQLRYGIYLVYDSIQRKVKLFGKIVKSVGDKIAVAFGGSEGDGSLVVAGSGLASVATGGPVGMAIGVKVVGGVMGMAVGGVAGGVIGIGIAAVIAVLLYLHLKK